MLTMGSDYTEGSGDSGKGGRNDGIIAASKKKEEMALAGRRKLEEFRNKKKYSAEKKLQLAGTTAPPKSAPNGAAQPCGHMAEINSENSNENEPLQAGAPLSEPSAAPPAPPPAPLSTPTAQSPSACPHVSAEPSVHSPSVPGEPLIDHSSSSDPASVVSGGHPSVSLEDGVSRSTDATGESDLVGRDIDMLKSGEDLLSKSVTAQANAGTSIDEPLPAPGIYDQDLLCRSGTEVPDELQAITASFPPSTRDVLVPPVFSSSRFMGSSGDLSYLSEPNLPATSLVAARSQQIDSARDAGKVPPKPQAAPDPQGTPENMAEHRNESGWIAGPPSAFLSRNEFFGLEQHIEDLTKEKFALQRGLDMARELADSLSQENVSLAADFNKQGGAMEQLKQELMDMEAEMRGAKKAAVEAQARCERAQQEGGASSERARALAAEVVALEERVLRLRSHELKLERDLEASTAEREGHRRAITSLEKERASLRSLIDGLQEDKRMLQQRLRKMAVGGALQDMLRGPSPQAPSVSSKPSQGTEDAKPVPVEDAEPVPVEDAKPMPVEDAKPVPVHSRSEAEEAKSGPPVGLESSALAVPKKEEDADMPLTPPKKKESTSASMERIAQAMAAAARAAAGSTASSSHPLTIEPAVHASLRVLPHDDLLHLESINNLIAEIAEERAALARALQEEAAAAAELRMFNAELSQRLAGQTQRLELAMAQSLVPAHGPKAPEATAPAPSAVVGPSEYLDEGDEVAERMLGWILQLLPGGKPRKVDKLR